ncbi:MAG: protein kinase [Phycisphaera sp.]|nr:protein kinase [Phycisphaera sp.]
MADKPPSHSSDLTLTSQGPSSRPRTISGESSIKVGSKLGKYQVDRLLGQGGMGAVYEATDTVLHRKVALKFLPEAVANDDKALKRFVREARAAARLNHPNVVTVYDVARTKTTCVLAMEFVDGVSVQHLLDSKGRMAFEQATRLTADACRALIAAHGADLIHRDIKPANLLVTPDGHAKVADFGLAKSLNTEDLAITQKNAVLGTPTFMSPEQCQNTDVDARTDIYALGATYYAMLTGRVPYERDTALQMLYAHCTEPPPDPRSTIADLPLIGAHIIQKSMAKRRDDRYASAADMLKDLERALAGSEPLQDPRPSPPPRDDGSPLLDALSSATQAPAPTAGTVIYETSRKRKKSGVLPMLIVGGVVAACIVVGLLAMILYRLMAGFTTLQTTTPSTVTGNSPSAVSTIAQTNPSPLNTPDTSANLNTPPIEPHDLTGDRQPTVDVINPPTIPPPTGPSEPAFPAPPQDLPTPSPSTDPLPQENFGPTDDGTMTPPPSVDSNDDPDRPGLNPLMRQVIRIRLVTERAVESGHDNAVEMSARRLNELYHRYKDAPEEETREAAQVAKNLAEKYRPGITNFDPGPPPGEGEGQAEPNDPNRPPAPPANAPDGRRPPPRQR